LNNHEYVYTTMRINTKHVNMTKQLSIFKTYVM